jgi:hypothetical protein
MRGQVGVEDLLGAAVGWPCWRFLQLRHGRPRPQHLLHHDGSSSLARGAGALFGPVCSWQRGSRGGGPGIGGFGSSAWSCCAVSLLYEVLQLLRDSEEAGAVAPERWAWCGRACSCFPQSWRGRPGVW